MYEFPKGIVQRNNLPSANKFSQNISYISEELGKSNRTFIDMSASIVVFGKQSFREVLRSALHD